MTNNNKNTTKIISGGIGFVGLLALVFIVLKLCGVIGWSWVWVLSPIWILLTLDLVALAIGLIALIVALIIDIRNYK